MPKTGRGGARVSRAGVPELMAAAVRHHRAGKLKRAERLYRQVLTVAPGHADALSSLGALELTAGRHAAALELLERAAAGAPGNPGIHMNLGAARDAAGRTDAAERAYRRAIELAPRYGDPYYNLGDLYLRLGRPADAIATFDACLAAAGRDYHALAYKAHALDDAGRRDEARYLLDFGRYLKVYEFAVPDGFAELAEFNAALAEHVRRHPTLARNVMATERGQHTGELMAEPKGPMAAMEQRIYEAVRWYTEALPEDPEHPAVRWAPTAWRLTAWGVVLARLGHERPHIHPNGWLSGVFYVQLPDVVRDPARRPEGWLEFGRPTPDLHVRSEPVLHHHQPDYGRMVLFPSYFYHGTVPFESEQRRICVSFDVEPLA